MTKQEFNDYISVFNKTADQFTLEEIYDICIKHKALNNKDKNWQELADKVGFKSGSALRAWTIRKQRADGTLPRNKALLSNRNIEEATTEEMATNLQEQIADLYKAKTQNRDILNTYRKGLRDEARVEALKEEIKAVAHSMKDLPKIEPYKQKEFTNVEAIVNFSDLHLGIEFKNYYNEYNYDIAIKRVNSYLTYVIYYCHLFNIRRLNILNLGDLVSGLIHPSLRMEQQMDVADQIMKAAEILSNFLNQLQLAAPEVIYRSVSDNHSRMTPDKNQSIEKENFGRIIDWYIEERLKKTKIKFPHDNIDVGIGYFKLLNGQHVVFSHGHNDKKNGCFQDMCGLLKIYPDYIIMAHYHSSAEHTYQNCKVYVNGSIVGTDTYAFEHRLFSEPEQKMLIFNTSGIINININLK